MKRFSSTPHLAVTAFLWLPLAGCGNSDAGSPQDAAGLAGAANSHSGTAGTGGGGSQESTITECNDGVDNDGDGLVDWQRDLGCANAADDDEAAAPREQEDGFTTFDLPNSGLVYYVSSSGGSDENDGLRPETALATIAQAKDLITETQETTGAWVLLRRGDTFEEGLRVSELHGAGPEDRIVFASYGEATQHPVLLNQRLSAIKTFSNLAIVGIDFNGEGRNPDSPNYVSADSKAGGSFVGSGENLLIESCRFSYGQVSIQAGRDGTGLKNVEFRRNVVNNAYSVDSHSQGLFTARLDGLLVEENVFDHNGWLIQQIDGGNDAEEGQATFFNHNMYLSSSNDVIVRGNLILRGASMGIKMRSDEPRHSVNVTIDENVFYEGELGVGIGGNTDEPDRFVNSKVNDNVFLHVGRARPTNRTLGWAISVAGHDGIEIAGNYILHQDTPEVRNTYGIALTSSNLRDVHVHDNVLYRINNRGIRVNVGPNFENLVIEDNIIDLDDLEGHPVVHSGGFEAFSYRNNAYRSGRPTDEWFKVDDSRVSLEQWVEMSGASGATKATSSFSDPDRTLGSYNEHLGGDADDLAFIEQARGLSRWQWNQTLTAAAVRAYIAAGFE